MFASAARNLSKSTLRGKKKQKTCVLSIVQLLKQLKNANIVIGQNRPNVSSNFFWKLYFPNFQDIKENTEN